MIQSWIGRGGKIDNKLPSTVGESWPTYTDRFTLNNNPNTVYLSAAEAMGNSF